MWGGMLFDNANSGNQSVGNMSTGVPHLLSEQNYQDAGLEKAGGNGDSFEVEKILER